MSSSDKEVLLVTERFHPDTTSATGQYMTDIAIGLQNRGLDVTVLTRSITGFEDSETQERINSSGVNIKRIPIPDIEQSNLIRRFINWFSFLLIAVPLMLVSRSSKQRYVIFVSYPIIMPPIIWAICRLRNWKYMYIIHDYYPKAAVELGYIKRDGIIDQIWSKINQHLLIDADDIVVLGPKMREVVVDSVDSSFSDGFDEKKVSIVHNWADGSFIKPRSKEENWFSKKHGLVDQFSLVYSGNIGEFHELETLVEATAEFNADEIRTLIIGEGDNKSAISDLASEMGVLGEQINILPYQPWETVPYSLTAGDVSIVAVKPEFEGLCVSSKLYSALATGQPVLVIAKETDDESQIIKQFDAGIQVDPGSTAQVLAAIDRWKNNPSLVEKQGDNAREAFEKHFTEDTSVEKYYNIVVNSPNE